MADNNKIASFLFFTTRLESHRDRWDAKLCLPHSWSNYYVVKPSPQINDTFPWESIKLENSLEMHLVHIRVPAPSPT